MFGDGFEQSTILKTGPDGLARVITRSSWDRRESLLVEAFEAEAAVLRRWAEFHHEAFRVHAELEGVQRAGASGLTCSPLRSEDRPLR
jgi:hypothetical protein